MHCSCFPFHVSCFCGGREGGQISRSGVVEGEKGDERLRREGGRRGDTRHLSSLQLSVVIDSPADCETLRGQD